MQCLDRLCFFLFDCRTQVAPTAPPNHFVMGCVLLSLGSSHYDEAAFFFETVLRLTVDSELALSRLRAIRCAQRAARTPGAKSQP